MTVSNSNSEKLLKIGWITSQLTPKFDSACSGKNEEDWLKRQLTTVGHEVVDISWEDLSGSASLDRIVAFCESRVEMPEMQENLANCFVPSAIATSSWHLGAGRTGLRETTTPTIPWYRFWDAWLNWLELDLNGVYPIPPRHLHSLVPSEWANIPELKGLIVTGATEHLETWTEVASELGQQTVALLWAELEGAGSEFEPEALDWILWDESCLDTCNQFVSSNKSSPRNITQLAQQFELLRNLTEKTPQTPLFAAIIHPHWQTWEQLHALGALAIIAKPESGVSLGRVLNHLARRTLPQI